MHLATFRSTGSGGLTKEFCNSAPAPERFQRSTSGTVHKIFEEAIKIAPGVSAITHDGAIFQDGSSGKYDAIIFATGYRPNYQCFLETNEIKPLKGKLNKENSSIYFVGFRISITGLLRDISKEAIAVADSISSQHNAAPAFGQTPGSANVAH